MRKPCSASRQRGVYALEWAIIFPVFFALLYGIVCYGLTFLVRSSMQHAVEEGARAALRYPSSTIMNGAAAPNWAHRRTEAQNAVVNALSWLPNGLRPTVNDIKFTVCRLNNASCNHTTDLELNLVCNASLPCLVLVAYEVNYKNNAIAPSIPGLGLVLPDSLQAHSSILVDRRML